MTDTSLLVESEQSPAGVSEAPFKVWLPGPVYEAIPYFYILSGFCALFASLYIDGPYALMPYWFLFTTLSIHAGIWILWQRQRYRRQRARQAAPGATA